MICSEQILQNTLTCGKWDAEGSITTIGGSVLLSFSLFFFSNSFLSLTFSLFDSPSSFLGLYLSAANVVVQTQASSVIPVTNATQKPKGPEILIVVTHLQLYFGVICILKCSPLFVCFFRVRRIRNLKRLFWKVKRKTWYTGDYEADMC